MLLFLFFNLTHSFHHFRRCNAEIILLWSFLASFEYFLLKVGFQIVPKILFLPVSSHFKTFPQTAAQNYAYSTFGNSHFGIFALDLHRQQYSLYMSYHPPLELGTVHPNGRISVPLAGRFSIIVLLFSLYC